MRNSSYDLLVVNGRDDFDLPSTFLTDLNVYVEDSFKHLGPAHGIGLFSLSLVLYEMFYLWELIEGLPVSDTCSEGQTHHEIVSDGFWGGE